jgi:hypothetical protein
LVDVPSGVHLLEQIAKPHLASPAGSYNFKIEQTEKDDDRIICLIAVTDNLLVARAAFDAAVQHHPRGRWQLRQGTRVVERYEPEAA